ncbi:MAG: nuclear transport factor 2 family protein [Actinobacteria bacterium]|nr:nuclear transport factor 2 family protein [Actinomycetota bacterium]
MSASSSIQTLNEYNDAWKRGDLEAGANFYAEDIVVHMGGLGPLSRDYRGRDDFLQNWVAKVEAYTDSWDVEGQEVLISGDEGVSIAVNVHWSRGDRKVTARRIGVYRIVDGKIVESWYVDSDGAAVDAFFDEITPGER